MLFQAEITLMSRLTAANWTETDKQTDKPTDEWETIVS